CRPSTRCANAPGTCRSSSPWAKATPRTPNSPHGPTESRTVPHHPGQPAQARQENRAPPPMSRRQVELKTVPQMQTMQRAGLVLHRALDAAVAAAVPGTTTAAVDAVFAAVLEGAGATPNFLGYYGYPKTICAPGH